MTECNNDACLLRCNTRKADSMPHFARIANQKIADNNNTIYIGVYFHICVKYANNNDIIRDIKYSIDSLNKDFKMMAANYGYGRELLASKNQTAPYNQIYASLMNYITMAYDANIIFVCAGFRNNIINVSIKNAGNYDTEIIDLCYQKSPPVEQPRYLNLYIIDYDGLLGFAIFPWDTTSKINGVFINSQTFGDPKYRTLMTDYNMNKTMTHEIGHWCGLLHTFQDYATNYTNNTEIKAAIDYSESTDIQEVCGDCVIDTPPQQGPTFGNPVIDKLNTATFFTQVGASKYCPMFINFMDYSNDICMYIFTRDQVTKMRMFLLGYRSNIITNPISPSYDFTVQQIPATPTPIAPITIAPITLTTLIDYVTVPITYTYMDNAMIPSNRNNVARVSGSLRIFNKANITLQPPISPTQPTKPFYVSYTFSSLNRFIYMGYYVPTTKQWNIYTYTSTNSSMKTITLRINQNMQTINKQSAMFAIGIYQNSSAIPLNLYKITIAPTALTCVSNPPSIVTNLNNITANMNNAARLIN